jgi:hypothetical protein
LTTYPQLVYSPDVEYMVINLPVNIQKENALPRHVISLGKDMIPLAFYRNDDSREVWSLLLYVYREIRSTRGVPAPEYQRKPGGSAGIELT